MRYIKTFEEIDIDNDFDWEEDHDEYIEDKSLVNRFQRAKAIDDWRVVNFPKQDMVDLVIDYLNKKLKIIYSLKNNPDDPFVATIRKEKLVKNGHVTLRKDGNEKCYEFYFDSNNYHFEIWVFLTEDKRIFLTDWPEDRNRTEEIANYN